MATTPKKIGLKSVRNWLLNLLGKPAPVDQEDTPQAPESQDPQEDSVAQDVQTVKTIFGKVTDKISLFLAPFTKKGIASAASSATAVRTSVDNKFLKNLVRTFLILFFTLILVFIGIYLFRMLKEENVITQNPGLTVTPPPFEPFKPSVYAQDPEVLKIEEDVNILERELNQTKIREDGINPPSLDFDISF